MHELRRLVRFIVNPQDPDGAVPSGHGLNTFAGTPCMRGLGRYYEIEAVAAGDPDPVTGYLIGIKDLDVVVREAAIPLVTTACLDKPWTSPLELMPALFRAVDARLRERAPPGPAPARLRALRWWLTPYYSVEMRQPEMDTVILRQQFDFAAAHRLHVPSLSDDANRTIFGRCNNPSGHGHNYRIEPAVALRVPVPGDAPFGLDDLERLTMQLIVARFDHKHLNADTPEFNPRTGLNPSIENMAKIFFDILAPAIDQASSGRAALQSMTVWETDRTSCTFPA